MRRFVVQALLLALLAAPQFAAAGMRPRFGGAATAAVSMGAATDPAAAVEADDRFVAALLHQPPLGRDPDGGLRPILLEELPRAEAGGTRFLLRLRAGLRFHDGRPIRAADLAATLRRLADGPWAALVLPVRALEVRGDRLLEVRLAHPLPHWPAALAEVATGVVPAGAAAPTTGAGPFRAAARRADGWRLEAFDGHAAGRPFLDAIELQQVAEADFERAPAPAAIACSWLLLGPGVEAAPDAFVDREELVRHFVPGAAAPLEPLLPPPHGAPIPQALAPAPAGRTLELIFDREVEGHRQVAERIQLRLHDRGVAVRLSALDEAALRERARAGRYDLALAQLPVPAEAPFAAAALLHEAGRREDALRLLAAAGRAGEDPAAVRAATAAALDGTAGIVPLYATTEAIAPALPSLVGGPGVGDVWLLPAATGVAP